MQLNPGFYGSSGTNFKASIGVNTTSASYEWVYKMADHLGRTRVLFTHRDGDGSIKKGSDTDTNEVLAFYNYSAFSPEMGGCHLNASMDAQRYAYNGKEKLTFSRCQDYRARHYDQSVGRFTGVDPLAEKFPIWSPYNYTMNNPINLIDPTGMAPEDWVGANNADGTTTWKWDSNIRSAEQAKNAGYDDYIAPGKIVATTSGDKVRLGEEGAIHTGIICIHSNVGADAGFTDGHAWVSTSNIEGNIQNTFSLWPDAHPLFQGTDPSGSISDVRTDTELKAGYATISGNNDFYVYATSEQMEILNNSVGTYAEWGYTNTCASWSSKALRTATGVKISGSEVLGATGTPRQISNSIITKGANTLQNPSINEKNAKRSSF